MSSESPSEPSITSLGPCSTAFDVLKATKADLSGKTAIVTGGASGIGAVTSEALAKAGAKVIIACRRVAEGEKVAAEIKSKGYKVRERGEGRRRERGSDAVRSVDPHRSLLASTSSWRHHETSRSFPRLPLRSSPNSCLDQGNLSDGCRCYLPARYSCSSRTGSHGRDVGASLSRPRAERCN